MTLGDHNTTYGSNNDEIYNGSSRELSKAPNAEKSIAEMQAEETQKRFHRRVWIAITLCCICYVVSFLSLTPVSIQYFSYRIARDKYHFSYNDSSNSKCSNASSKLEDLMDKTQKDASKLILESGLASGIPAVFTCVLVGSYSDYIGRKPILIASIFGGLIRLLLMAFIVKFDWNLHLYFIGSAVDGICGSYFTFILATTAIIADVTPDSKNRALHFAVIEGLMLPTAAAAQVGIGYMMKDDSFFVPTVCMAGLLVVSLVINVFILPETVQWKRAFTWNPKLHIKKVVGFYCWNESKTKRKLYLFGLCAFVVVALTNIGRQNVETLFQLNRPLCWDSVQIGTYTAIRIMGTALITVVFLKLMTNRLSLEFTGVICAISGIAGFVFFGLSQTSAELYFAALVGSLYFGCIPIPRALLSQLAPHTEQGALFSGLSVVDTVSSLVSSAVFTIIYNSTLDSFKGTVFMVIAGCVLLNAGFLLAFRFARADSSLSDFQILIEPVTGEGDKQEHRKGGLFPGQQTRDVESVKNYYDSDSESDSILLN